MVNRNSLLQRQNRQSTKALLGLHLRHLQLPDKSQNWKRRLRVFAPIKGVTIKRSMREIFVVTEKALVMVVAANILNGLTIKMIHSKKQTKRMQN